MQLDRTDSLLPKSLFESADQRKEELVKTDRDSEKQTFSAIL